MSLRAGCSPEGPATMARDEPVGGERLWKSPARRSPGPVVASAGGPAQAACLKQILLLQLDLIEQQQRQLQAREREIGQLRGERDTLLARIERMERRMQLVKKDSEKEKRRLFHETELTGETAPLTSCDHQPVAGHLGQTLPHKPLSFGRIAKGHKRKNLLGNAERKTPVKKLAAEFSKLKTKTPKNSPVKEELSDSLLEASAERKLRSNETPERVQPLILSTLKSCTSVKGPNASLNDRGLLGEAEELPYLSTTEMYLCRWHEPPPSPLREPSPKKEESVANPISEDGRSHSRPSVAGSTARNMKPPGERAAGYHTNCIACDRQTPSGCLQSARCGGWPPCFSERVRRRPNLKKKQHCFHLALSRSWLRYRLEQAPELDHFNEGGCR